ncbi:hypothetical protein GRI89_02775 [Altererythrobacter salegens]|uniref:Uncharacterized protein n=1 Tax=Croceibacterium salegens TaxID=1737568 RepID=A0A6I4SR75_9SPHN|nr:hypothetical protein [Croceibacterium salegens]MXO58471.1 hypothetical protein [Croceibacterium salegens]
MIEPVTDRTLIAYALIAVLVASFGALIWWIRYNSEQQTVARENLRRRKQDDARALKSIAKDEGGERS